MTLYVRNIVLYFLHKITQIFLRGKNPKTKQSSRLFLIHPPCHPPKNDNFTGIYLVTQKQNGINYNSIYLWEQGLSLWSSDCCLLDLHSSRSVGQTERNKPLWWEHSHWQQSEDQRDNPPIPLTNNFVPESPNIFLWNYHFCVHPHFKLIKLPKIWAELSQPQERFAP